MTASTMEQQTPAVQEPVHYWNRQRRIGVGLAAAGVVSAVLFGSLATGQQAQFTLNLGYAVANAPAMPTWKKGEAFGSVKR